MFILVQAITFFHITIVTLHFAFQTGTGFIKMEDPNGKCFSLAPETSSCHESCKGNPATNDWIPAADDTVKKKKIRPHKH